MEPFRIAVAQLAISRDAAENGPAVRRLMREASARGARLILFPEGMLSGYAKEQIGSWDEVDWDVVRAELRAVMALAAELRLWVVLGSAHPLTPPNRPHNSLYVISDEGRIVDRYDKRFCSSTETQHYFVPGSRPTVFEVDGFRFGCVICVEVNFPQLFTEYERLGVDCLLFPAYPVDTLLEVKARAYASINDYWVALSGPAQTSHLLPTELIGPHGLVLARVDDGADLVVADLDRSDPALDIALNKARPWRALVNAGDFYRAAMVDDDPRSTDRTCV
ncbi:MAG: putative hydrolase protein [uncultured Thermomicrobiales bacterium]|uniref:Putative hydrolase protein n=1 Tax=uncultured Thermomicrobiales bacterium TaxID=1645740 RepID=A0A6J4UC35_9BACT|nr:MAG: putative hydrolase protein [uncultured Thermomicrobiales bacterium]